MVVKLVQRVSCQVIYLVYPGYYKGKDRENLSRIKFQKSITDDVVFSTGEARGTEF